MTDQSEHRQLTEEEARARRSNRRTLIAIFVFVVVLGLVPLAVGLIDKLS